MEQIQKQTDDLAAKNEAIKTLEEEIVRSIYQIFTCNLFYFSYRLHSRSLILEHFRTCIVFALHLLMQTNLPNVCPEHF